MNEYKKNKLEELKQLIQEIEMIKKDYSNQIEGILKAIKEREDENLSLNTYFTRAKIKRLRIYLHEKQVELDKLLQDIWFL